MATINDLDTLRGTERRCGTCACFRTREGLAPGQGVCLLVTPEQVLADVPVPRMRGNVPDVDREGRPIMISQKVPALRHAPALESGVCYSGWRPIGTRPGESAPAAQLRMAFPRFVDAMNRRVLDPAEIIGLAGALLGADLPAGMPGADLAAAAGLAPDPAGTSAGTKADFSGTGGDDGTRKDN